MIQIIRIKVSYNAYLLNQKIKKYIKDLDMLLLLPVISLCLFGVAAVFWAGLSPQFSSPFALVKSKVAVMFIGLGAAGLFSQIDYHHYEKPNLQAAGCLTLILFLCLLFFLGLKEYGANLRFALMNRTVQPTEYVKLMVVIVLSYTIIETYQKGLLGYLVFSVHSLPLTVFTVLIAMQPDYGAVLIIITTAMGMLIVARIKAGRSLVTFILFAGAAGGLFLGACVLWDNNFYVLDRFRIYVSCFLVNECSEYQIANAYHAISSGGFWGADLSAALHPHGILPMECNDFIFCVIAEETGFLGTSLFLMSYMMLIHRGFEISKQCRDFFGQLMAFGLTWLIGFQALLNMMVATGLFPITGVTLPLISHGGNSMLSVMIAVGILNNIAKHQHT